MAEKDYKKEIEEIDNVIFESIFITLIGLAVFILFTLICYALYIYLPWRK